MWYAASSTTKFVQMMTLGMTMTYFTARSNLVPYAFVWDTGIGYLLSIKQAILPCISKTTIHITMK